MKMIEKFKVTVKAAYNASFHKENILGKMGYLHDELEVVGNAIDYMAYSNNLILFLETNNELCKSGIEYFLQHKYKDAFELFKTIPKELVNERNYVLAICYLYGKGTKRNRNLGFRMAKEGAEVSICCKQLLARCYLEGITVPVNKKKAYQLFIETIELIQDGEAEGVDEDYIMPDMFYFCGEYEMENGDSEKAIDHLKVAALDRNFGLAYYLLGKYYFESDTEKANQYLDKAKKLNVNVSTKYYSKERAEVADTPIDMGASDGLEKVSHTFEEAVKIKENMELLDPERIRKNHLDAKTERINSQTEEKKARAMNEIADIDIKTAKIRSQTGLSVANAENDKAAMKAKRWKKRNN